MLIEVRKIKLTASVASKSLSKSTSLSGQLVQSGRTWDRGVNIVSVPTKSGRLATMQYYHLLRNHVRIRIIINERLSLTLSYVTSEGFS